MIKKLTNRSIDENMFFYILVSSIILALVLIVEIIILDYPLIHLSTWLFMVLVSSLGIYSNITGNFETIIRFVYFGVMIFFLLPYGWLYSDVMSPFPLVYALVMLIAVGNLLVGKMRLFLSIGLMVVSIIMLTLGLIAPEIFPVIPKNNLIKDIFIQIPITFSVSVFLLISFSNDLKLKNERLENTTTRDYLTGLYNRRYIYKYLDKKQQSFDHNLEVIIGVIDVNKFKNINDTYGHVVGDKVLTSIASHIQTLCGSSAIIGRTGGDEFVVVMNYNREFSIKHFSNKFRQSKIEYLGTDIEEVPLITISGGFVICSIKTPIDTMIATADANMYEVKSSNLNGIMITRK